MAFKLTLLLCDGMFSSATTLTAEIFVNASAMARANNKMSDRLLLRTVTPTGRPVSTSSGFDLTPSHSLEEIDSSDLIHVPALWRNPRPALKNFPEYIPWLAQQHALNTHIISVGTGVCFLAEAGLMDDKPATTHWHYFDQFQRDYPRVKLQRQHFTTQAGNLYCCASMNAMAELMTYQVQRIYGETVSRHTQRNFFHEIRNHDNPITLSDKKVARHSDELIAQAQIWLQDNLSRAIYIPELAKRFDMSTRTFNRRFKQAIHTTPADYLLNIRMTFACDLLKNTNLSILDIASLSGFNENTYFTARFKHWAGTTPKAYRETVRAKLFETGDGS